VALAHRPRLTVTRRVIDARALETYLRPSLLRRKETEMSAYAVAILKEVELGPDIAEYLRRIDSTLEPFDGRFLIHGGAPDTPEGAWEGDLIVIGFPDVDRARAWYRSDAYQEILPLRTANSQGQAILIDGVDADHRATDVLDGVVAAG
jgi:uncharacterized protein (DUF1330 family)